MTDEAPLPKQALLCKLMRMTASDNDGEALVALRKATTLLASAGWTWDKLIEGKIVVVEDPFASIPDVRNGMERRPVQQPQQAQPFTPTWPAQAPPPTPTTAPHRFAPRIIVGAGTNKFPGFCYVCGTEIAAGWGKYFYPKDFNMNAPRQARVLCLPCENIAPTCQPSAAPEVRKPRKKSINDLA